MTRLMDRMLDQFRGWDWEGIPPNQPVYAGVSVDVGPDGVPHVRRFGNVAPGGEGLLEGGVREPFVTCSVDPETRKVHVTAEMPGVSKEAVNLEATYDALVLRAKGDDRAYEKTVKLPRPVDPDSAKARYQNGVLEVTLDARENEPPQGHKVKVD